VSAVVWVNEDHLAAGGPALAAAPAAPAVFVLDDAVIRFRGYGLKRLGFIYECLLELPVEIRRGPTVEVVAAFAARHAAARVLTTPSPCPHLRALMAELAARLSLELLAPVPFVEPPGRLDLARFSRYWRAVEAAAMRPSGTALPASAARPRTIA
jgi:hypothetical protein